MSDEAFAIIARRTHACDVGPYLLREIHLLNALEQGCHKQLAIMRIDIRHREAQLNCEHRDLTA